MNEETLLREKIRKLEALFAGAGTPGEKDAAEAGLERIRARLAELQTSDPPIEMQFSLSDPWTRKLFLALCRRYGLKPYRLPRQRMTTVMLRVPRKFKELSAALRRYLDEVTTRVIREEVHRDTSEAREEQQSLLTP